MYSTLTRNFEKQSERDQPLVLIVDDNYDNLLFASYVVELMGMHYVIAENGEECLSLVYEQLPDIILLDVVMPKMNGLEIAQIIKQNKKISHIPIIAVTGLTKTEDKNKLLEGGFDDYLCKPYFIEELEAKLYLYLQPPSV